MFFTFVTHERRYQIVFCQFATGAEVFRFAGAVSFIAYTVANWQNTIWYRRSWVTNVKNTIDGLVYGIATAAPFTWLWPA